MKDTLISPKRHKSKNRDKTEENCVEPKSKNSGNSKDKKKQLITNNLSSQKNNPNFSKMITENNTQPKEFKIFYRSPIHKSSKISSSSFIDEDENNIILNEIDKKFSKSPNKKLNLIFSQKSSCNTNDTDNKILSFKKNVKKRKESQPKLSNFELPNKNVLNDLYKNKDLKNYKDQKFLISSQNLNKNISNENNNNNITKHIHNIGRAINNSEKIDLDKLFKNKNIYYFNDDEEESKEEEKDNEDLKMQYGYVSSSGSENENKKEEKKTKFNSKEKSRKEKNNNINNEKSKKSPTKEKSGKNSPNKDKINKNKRINVKSACDIKIYKEYDDKQILQNNNININDHFTNINNMYISSAYTLAKEKDGKQCQNEDSYLIKENIFGKNFNVYGIFDGHGEGSHKVSKNIAENMGKFFSSKKKIYKTFLKSLIKNAHENNGINFMLQLEQNHENGEIPLKLHEIKKIFIEDDFNFIKKSVRYCEKKLKDKEYDLKFTGSTCVMLFLFYDKLICSNIGNSRCILFKCTENDKWTYINLSNEHKPTNEEERKRIRKKGGEIHPFIDKNGNYEDNIQRIWVKDKKYPGLTISRSIGDLIGKKIGIISTPTFICKKIDNRCKFIILGSDGFWDAIEFSEIIKIVKPYLKSGNPEIASKLLVEKAKKSWSKISERDDISVIVIFISEDLTTKYETNKNLKITREDY